MRKFILAFYILFPSILMGQNTIKGRIVDSTQQGVPQVTLQILSLDQKDIITYGFSDIEGKYTLSFRSNAGHVLIKISAMGFKTILDTIATKTGIHNYQLATSEIQLEPVKLDYTPIEERGDTLIYKVSAFTEQSDRSIADVLKNMPGIEVNDDGKIFFNGTPINKFYIENMDLLGGNYSLASENLPYKEVKEVQVLRHHQPIKILQGRRYSGQAAINLTLKDSYTFTGKAELGAGLAPLLWHANLTPMVFAKKRQFLASLQSNNVGNDLTRKINNTGAFSGITASSPDLFSNPWLDIIQARPGGIPRVRYLDNSALLFSPNYLEKLSNDYRFRVNIDYLTNRVDQYGRSETRYYTPTDTIPIFEEIKNRIYSHKLNVNLLLQKNIDKKYFIDKLQFHGNWNDAQGHISGLNNPVHEDLNSRDIGVANIFETAFLWGEQLINFSSTTSLSQSTEQLIVKPGQFSELLNNGNPYDQLRQNFKIQSFQTDNSIFLSKSLDNFKLSSVLGFYLEYKKLNSRIFADDTLLTDAKSKNKLTWFKSSFYLSPSIGYDGEGFSVEFQTNISFDNYQLQNRNFENQSLHPFIFNPFIELRFGLFDYTSGTISAGYSTSYKDYRAMYPGLILTNYRNIQSYDSPFSKNTGLQFHAGLNYGNVLNFLSWKLDYHFSKIKRNLITDTKILPGGAQQIVTRREDNIMGHHQISGELITLIDWIRTTIKFKPELGWTYSSMILDDNKVFVKNRRQSFEGVLSHNFATWFQANYTANFSFYQSKFESYSMPSTHHISQKLELKISPNEKQYIGFSTTWVNTQFMSGIKNNLFADFTYRYSLKNIDFELKYSNIFNNDSYRISRLSSYQYSESFYRLRPWEILLKVSFSI